MTVVLKLVPAGDPQVDVWKLKLVTGNQRAWLATIKGYTLATQAAEEEAKRRKAKLAAFDYKAWRALMEELALLDELSATSGRLKRRHDRPLCKAYKEKSKCTGCPVQKVTGAHTCAAAPLAGLRDATLRCANPHATAVHKALLAAHAALVRRLMQEMAV